MSRGRSWRSGLIYGGMWAMSVLAFGLSSGCKVYHSLPLDRRAKEAALATPDPGRIQVQTRELKHPILKPQAIDFRNGVSPDEAAILAVVANPDLQAVRNQRALASAQLLEAGLLPDPILSYGQDFPVGNQDPGTITADSTQLSLDLTAILTLGLRRRAAKAEQHSVDLDVAWQEWQVAEAAKLSVYRLLALEPQVEFAEEAVQTLDETLRALEKGGMTQGDMALARVAFDSAKRYALSQKQARERERMNLNGLLGLPPSEQLKLKPPPGVRPWETPPSEQTLVMNLDHRLDLVALQKGYESQDARVRLAIWSQFPSIGLTLSRAKDTSSIVTHGYAVAVSLPLFNRAQGMIAVENATRQQLFDQYRARLFHARSEVAQILADLASIQEMLLTAQKALPDIEAQAKASETSFTQGDMDLLSRNQARMALLTQKATLAGLKSSQDELGVALEIASGGILQEISR